jgi:hypothetical protein
MKEIEMIDHYTIKLAPGGESQGIALRSWKRRLTRKSSKSTTSSRSRSISLCEPADLQKIASGAQGTVRHF